MGQTLTIGEAAALLGVHRNTVRNRIKAGHYNAHKIVTPQGETYAIERDSLDLVPTNAPNHGSHAQGHRNSPNPSQAPKGLPAIVDDGQQAQQFAIVQSLLAPFIEQLGATKVELGRVTERLEVIERERDELRRQLAEQQAELRPESLRNAHKSTETGLGAAIAPSPNDESPAGPASGHGTRFARWWRWISGR